MRSGIPLIVVFTYVACEPTHNNICSPLSKKKLETLIYGNHMPEHVITHLNSQSALIFKVLASHKQRNVGTMVQLVEPLHYEPVGCGFNSRWCD
jgi:hypothetical protein